ncbi:uncharacterized protein LOC109839281 [Asparagus officinalis]|uniref:uncharacterized protein LOC109839281 n=1 Tax=Asparagus officinalis TaxID=4686 RepID=UPI00098DEC8D|nr:uncharacterized protein LOC109839281 [Asparagus officinalis]
MLGTDLSDNRLVQKILVSLPERYEATIASLENTRDLSQIKLAELVSALQAPEQRRSIRLKGSVEEALRAKMQHNLKEKRRSGKGRREVTVTQRLLLEKAVQATKEEDILHTSTVVKRIIPILDVGEGQIWLIDSGCTNHMTSDKKLFRNLDKSIKSRVRIRNGEYLAVEGRGTMAMKSCPGIKLIFDVMYIPEIDQNLLSVGQLVGNGFKVTFEEGKWLVFDSRGQELFKIKMQQKSFSLNTLKKEQVAFKC